MDVPGNEYFVYNYDPQGSVVQMLFPTDEFLGEGQPRINVNETAIYTAYGTQAGEQVPTDSGFPVYTGPEGVFRYGGQWGYYTDSFNADRGSGWFGSTDLVFMTHRYYEPGFGKFQTRDPIGYQGGINLYGFVGNNPVTGMDPEGTDVRSPGFLESLIPVWGSGRESIHDFQTGKWGWGVFNGAMAVSDVFLAKAALMDLGKVGVKGLIKVGGSHSWQATRSWLTRKGWQDFAGQPFHHWALNQAQGIGKHAPEWLKNQPWNLKGITKELAERYRKPGQSLQAAAQDVHNAIHGKSRSISLNPAQRLLYGTPTWAKAGAVSAGGRGIDQTFGR